MPAADHTEPVANRTAQCACGQLIAQCVGDPKLVSLCHCLDCQRRTGSPFGIAAFFACADVRTAGQSQVYVRGSDSGSEVRFHFCPQCGATVFWYPERKPGVVAVAVGAFADPAFPVPSQSVYGRHRHDWVGPLPGGGDERA